MVEVAWLTAHPRLARDYERLLSTSDAMIRWAAINGMVRRRTSGKPAARQRAWTPRRPQGLTFLKTRSERPRVTSPRILPRFEGSRGADRSATQ
jgi:hypothetical protein